MTGFCMMAVLPFNMLMLQVFYQKDLYFGLENV